ncbi:hypothetical protein J6590_081340 [Homalodisca vitripennis]|nr:hypothetical protein J6590_081340 [Homalodisca vitripennis]
MNLQNNNHVHVVTSWRSVALVLRARARLNMNLQNNNHVHVVTSWRSVALVLRASAEHESAEQQSCTCCNFLEECCARAQGQVLNMILQNDNHVHVVTSWRSVGSCSGPVLNMNLQNNNHVHVVTSWRSVELMLRARY